MEVGSRRGVLRSQVYPKELAYFTNCSMFLFVRGHGLSLGPCGRDPRELKGDSAARLVFRGFPYVSYSKNLDITGSFIQQTYLLAGIRITRTRVVEQERKSPITFPRQ